MFLLGGGGGTHTLAADGAGRRFTIGFLGWVVRNERNSDLDSRFYSWLGNIVVDGIASVHYWDAVLQTGTGRSLHIALVASFQGTVIVRFVRRRGVYYDTAVAGHVSVAAHSRYRIGARFRGPHHPPRTVADIADGKLQSFPYIACIQHLAPRMSGIPDFNSKIQIPSDPT